MAGISNSVDGWFDGTPGNVSPNIDLTSDVESVREHLDYAFRENGGPGFQSPLVNLLKGVRILGPGNQLTPQPDDTIGLAFVTRPMLNLSDENVKKHIQLAPLINPPRNSPMAYIKGLLDPRWGRGNAGASDMLDPLCPWIPLTSNLLRVSSGFPDVTLTMSKSNPGFRGEVYQKVGGLLKVNYDFDIRQSYNASKPNVLPTMFDMWEHYIEGVTLGDEGLEPYPEALIENYIDYDCRIYHLILNKNQRNLEGIYCTGQSIPNTFPSGAFSTIDRTQNSLRGQGQDELEINFSSVGFRYNNIRVVDMFNRTTLKFNPGMMPSVRANNYRKLAMSEYFSGGYGMAYPWININTMEVEYWGPIK